MIRSEKEIRERIAKYEVGRQQIIQNKERDRNDCNQAMIIFEKQDELRWVLSGPEKKERMEYVEWCINCDKRGSECEDPMQNHRWETRGVLRKEVSSAPKKKEEPKLNIPDKIETMHHEVINLTDEQKEKIKDWFSKNVKIGSDDTPINIEPFSIVFPAQVETTEMTFKVKVVSSAPKEKCLFCEEQFQLAEQVIEHIGKVHSQFHRESLAFAKGYLERDEEISRELKLITCGICGGRWVYYKRCPNCYPEERLKHPELERQSASEKGYRCSCCKEVKEVGILALENYGEILCEKCYKWSKE